MLPLLCMCPNIELKTSESRSVLPEQFDRAYAVRASANANMLAASLMVHDFERAGRYMEADLFHEPFRANLIPRATQKFMQPQRLMGHLERL